MTGTVAIVDIDGVLADASHREHHLAGGTKDWGAFFAAVGEDAPIPAGISRVRSLDEQHEVVLLTGRPEHCRDATRAWLERHGVPHAELLMRPDGDHRPARVFKAAAVQERWSPEQVHVMLDDDPAVVAALRSRGFPADQVVSSSHG